MSLRVYVCVHGDDAINFVFFVFITYTKFNFFVSGASWESKWISYTHTHTHWPRQGA